MRATGPLNMTDDQGHAWLEQGFTEVVLVAVVRNRGRLAVSVQDVSAGTDDGWGFQRVADPENPALPHRLEPGATTTWHVELRPFQMVVPEFVELIADSGAGLYACRASVDMFGLAMEDFVPHVRDIISVGEFYGIAAGGQIIFT
jgi:hypothetical protein